MKHIGTEFTGHGLFLKVDINWIISSLAAPCGVN